MEVRDWRLSDIKPYPNNPRKRSKRAIEKVAASIREFGARQPIVVDENGIILVGHTRYDAALLLGMETFPVHQALGLSEAQKVAYRIADNRTNEETEWDDEKLRIEFASLGDLDLTLTGFDLRQVTSYIRGGPQVGEDDVPADAAPRVKAGDLWRLGEHRLLCGDCTVEADVERLMGGARAGLMNTDPPYLVDYDGMNHPSKWGGPERESKNKDWSESYGVKWNESGADLTLWRGAFATARRALRENAAWYVWHADRLSAELRGVLKEVGLLVHQCVIWKKNRPVLTRQWYMQSHEPALFGWIRGNKPELLGKEQFSTVWELPHDESKVGSIHPTQKPVELFAIPIRMHTIAGELVYEPFSGSGSQLIAAEREGRRCYGLEIEPKYCDVIIARWEKLTGKTAALESSRATAA